MEKEHGAKLEDGSHHGVLRAGKQQAGCCSTIYATSEAGQAEFHASKGGAGGTTNNLISIRKELN